MAYRAKNLETESRVGKSGSGLDAVFRIRRRSANRGRNLVAGDRRSGEHLARASQRGGALYEYFLNFQSKF